MALCVELASEDKEIGNRIQAALYLKNLFTAQDENIKQEKFRKWSAGDWLFLLFTTLEVANISIIIGIKLS